MYSYFRKKVNRWFKEKGHRKRYGRYILLVPDLLYLLVQLMLDRRITRRSRTIMLMAAIYLISPVDFFPELIVGPVGFLDDVALAIYALDRIINKEQPEVVRSHWEGEQDILELVQSTVSRANQWIGGGIWKRIKRFFG